VGRLLILLVPLALLLFGGGFMVGRAGRRKAVFLATSNVRPVVQAARNLATLNWLSDPESASLARQETLMAIDQYDQDQRRALNG
jgi:hypothetical protein